MPTSSRSHSTPATRSTASGIPPFWNRLNAFFLFPFQARPLLYAAVLSFCALSVTVSPLIGFFVVIGILLATARYSFKVSAMASMGLLQSADFDRAQSDPAWTNLPWKFLGVLIVHAVVIGLLGEGGERLGDAGSLASSLLVPATLMVLIQTHSFFSALNPAELMRAMGAVGMPYLLLCGFMLLLSFGMPMAWALLVPLAPKGLIAPAMAFIAIYFSWVSASMLGYAMYQNHERLDIDVVQEPHGLASANGSQRTASPADRLARERDAQLSDLVREGQLKEAYDLAYEWQRSDPDNLADQRRYHRVLLLSDKTDRLAWFTQKHVLSLLKAHKGQDALKVFESSLAKAPDLALESAEPTLALAEQAWKGMNAQLTLAILKGFDKRYPRDPAIPKAYELIGRSLHQGLGRTPQALAVLRGMEKQYPQHPATQELAWILRDHVAITAAGSQPVA